MLKISEAGKAYGRILADEQVGFGKDVIWHNIQYTSAKNNSL